MPLRTWIKAMFLQATSSKGISAMKIMDWLGVCYDTAWYLERRIDRMMEVIGDDPVMWVDVKTLVGSGAWSNPEMAKWNATLVEAHAKYPNIKVYNWTQVVHDAWFSSDRIHYTGEGYAERARLIADALQAAYPA